MKFIGVFVIIGVLATSAVHAQSSTTYVGYVTDTMCATDHKAMNVSPESQCVRECVGDGKAYKYAVAVGKNVYTLSDQETPAKFAGRKVKVTGLVYEKTRILKVETIAAAD